MVSPVITINIVMKIVIIRSPSMQIRITRKYNQMTAA